MKIRSTLNFIVIVFVGLLVVSCGGADERKVKYLSKGKMYLLQHNYDKARLEFKNVLQIDPKYAQGHYYMARVNEHLKSYRSALGGYNRALELKPDYKEALTGVGRIYLLGGAAEKAIEFSNKALALSAGFSEALAVRAAAHFHNNDIKKSLVDVRLALKSDENNLSALALLSRVYMHTEQVDKAESLLRAALLRKPGDTSLQVLLVQLYTETKEYQKAAEMVINLIQKDQQNLSYRSRLARYYVALEEKQKAEDVLRLAVRELPESMDAKRLLIGFLVDQRDPVQARQEMSVMLAEDNDNPELKLISAQLYFRAEEIAEAEKVYRDIIIKYVEDLAAVQARYELSRLLVNDKREPEAKQVLNQLLERNPTHSDALMLRGMLSLNENKPQDALVDFRTLQKDQPSSISLLKLMVRGHIQQAEYNQAEESLKKILTLMPNDPEALLTLAKIYHQNKNYQAAIENLNILIKIKPHNIEVRQLFFKVYVAEKKFNMAEKVADIFIKDNPQINLGYFYKGLILQARNKAPESMVFFEMALQKSPQAVEPLSAYVRAALVSKQPEKARRKLMSILEKNTDYLVAQNLLGEVLLQQKKYTQAEVAFQKAISLNPSWWIPYRNLASTQIFTDNIKQAIVTCRKGLEQAENKDRLSLQLALLLEKEGRLDELVSLYESMMQTSANTDVVANNLALILVDYFDDKTSMDRALSLVNKFQTSHNPNFLDTLGWVHFKRGEYDRALSALLQADDIAPAQLSIQYHLGSVYFSKGDSKKARKLLEIVAKSEMSFKDKTEAKRILKSINNA